MISSREIESIQTINGCKLYISEYSSIGEQTKNKLIILFCYLPQVQTHYYVIKMAFNYE